MMKSILAAGASLLTLAAVSAAEAKTVGHVSGSTTYVDSDIFGGKDINEYKFDFEGAAGFDLTPTWNIQFDTHFTSDRFTSDDAFGGKTLAIDTWRAGTQVYWRDSTQGLFGVEVAYNTIDGGFGSGALDGFLAGLKGEYYGSEAWTLGGGITYNTYEAFGGKSLDQFGGDLFATYYVNEKTGISLRGKYSSLDVGTDIDTWKVGADVEYLFQNNLSLAGALTYSSFSSGSSSDVDAFTFGAKLKVYFGTEGSLANQHRTGTLEATSGAIDIPLFGL